MDTRTRRWQSGEGRLARDTTRWLTERTFRRCDIPAVRRFARAFGLRAGMAKARLTDFVLAVSEAASSATAAGACTARVRLWAIGTRAFCQIRGDGMMRSAADPPATEEEALRRWVLRRLTDHASIAYDPDGVCVLLSMRVA